jgi:DNA-binding transcriptional MerR regulator
MSTPDNMPPPEEAEPLDTALARLTGEEIPDKLYFRIGEVARLAGIKPYVLRFWETEFGGLGPKKSGTGHRLYRRKDVELVLEIKRLLYEQRFTIEGARKLLENRPKAEPARGASKPSKSKPTKARPRGAEAQAGLFMDASPILDSVRQELTEILAMLK